MTNYSTEEIAKVMQERNVTRKSAIQFLRRQRKAAETTTTEAPAPAAAPVTDNNLLVAGSTVPESNTYKATEEIEADAAKFAPAAPLAVGDAVAQPTGEVTTVEATGTSTTTESKRRPRNTGFDAAKAAELYKAGTKVVDIAVALGYPKGQGQNRVRAALKAAGVYVERPAKPAEAPAAQ